MGRTAKYPKPKARFKKGWEIYWYWNYEQYSVNVGSQDPDDSGIESICRRIAVSLSMDMPAFPPEYADAPAVVRYLAKRHNVLQEEPEPPRYASDDDMLADYRENLLKHCAHDWAVASYNVIAKQIRPFVPGGVLKMTPALALQYLQSVLDRGKKPGTRNSHLAICSRFYSWCKALGLVAENPFAGIKRMKVPDIEEVAYCTTAERDRVIAAAKAGGRSDWIAVAIAFYAGCRREEVFNLQWPDINLAARRLVVRRSKTGKKRTTPLARELLALLEAAKKDRGYVVPRVAGETWENQADRLVELMRECLSRPVTPNYLGHSAEAVGKRKFAMTEEDLAKCAEADAKQRRKLARKLAGMKRGDKGEKETAEALACLESLPDHARDGLPWLPAERLGWNAWRHTFATLRAQAGVSLDKISDWMGNTYEVCKKHYTQFMPRGEHEEDIDK